MSTRSYIAIKNQDGTVRSIYHHWDGYPDGLGNILSTHYQNVDKINKLLDLGDMNQIGTEPIGIWSNYSSKDGTKCETYRERGESGVDAKIHKTEEDFLNYACEDYTYIYKEGKWFCRNWDGPLHELKKILDGEDNFNNDNEED